MTTNKKKSEVAELFKENVNAGIKWFQAANAAFIETQNKQLKLANDLCSKAVNSIQADEKSNLNFGVSGKQMVDTMQKNIEIISNVSKAAVKTLTDLGKQADANTFSNDVKHVLDIVNKRVEEITKLNQKSFETIVKQLNETKTSFTPLTEIFKKELDATVESSKESIQAIVDSYKKFATSSVEANKEIFDKLSSRINASVNANLKAWEELVKASTFTASANKSKVSEKK